MERIESIDHRRRAARRICRKIITYVVVCGFLAFINWITTPGNWWVLWVVAGWGLGVALQLCYYLTGCEDDENDC